MKSTVKKRRWKAIYKLLDRVSPVDFDCGKICNSACCSVDEELIYDANLTEDDMGIYLFPGEDKLHRKNDSWINWQSHEADDFDFPPSWHGKIHFIRCKTPPTCPRKIRPLQCRTYPLYPYIDDDDTLHLIYYPHFTPYSCPLIDSRIPLSERFCKATFTVWKRLIEDSLIYDLIKYESSFLTFDEAEIVYPPR